MKRLSGWTWGLLVVALAVFGCATPTAGSGWVTLIEGGQGLENWNRIGEANWRAENGAIVADRGKGGFLVSKDSYGDFELHAEFWAESDTNSGVFLRAANPAKIGGDSSYEVNIWDIRPDPSYGTGAIVNVAKVPVPTVHKAGGRWNTFEITARGDRLTVRLNGVVTVDVRDGKFAKGPVALQFGAGVKDVLGGPIKWRKVQVRAI